MWERLSPTKTYNRLMLETLSIREPETYRNKIPGYKKELYLLPVNKKMVKKILQVKKNNEEGMLSVGGASGITSMLSRAFETVKTLKTDYTSQRESINRLYRGPQLKP